MFIGYIILIILFIIATVLHKNEPIFNKLICYNKIIGTFLIIILFILLTTYYGKMNIVFKETFSTYTQEEAEEETEDEDDKESNNKHVEEEKF